MFQEDVRRPYTNYEYYKTQYHGEQIKSENDFKRAEINAEAFLDFVTFGRIAVLEVIPDAVHNAICSVSEAIALREEKNAYSVKSESNDGYSVSYGDAISDNAFRSELYAVVQRYLGNTRLLNRGWVREYDEKR